MRISDWSSDVCSSDMSLTSGQSGGTARGKLGVEADLGQQFLYGGVGRARRLKRVQAFGDRPGGAPAGVEAVDRVLRDKLNPAPVGKGDLPARSEEHTSELQSLMSISYAVFCLKKKKYKQKRYQKTSQSNNEKQIKSTET